MKSSAHQFKKLILNFNYLFKKDKLFYFFRINWLQMLRYHPQIFLRYKILYKSSFGFTLEFLKRLIKYIIIITKQILRSVFILDNNIYEKLSHVDCILVSHFSSKKKFRIFRRFSLSPYAQCTFRQ